MTTVPEPLLAAVDKWATAALDQSWVESWVEGAIFPRELVALLAMCEICQVQRIVESGRQDGYSTMALGEWSEATAGQVVSIDLELDPDRAREARSRLSRYPRVQLLKGDAYELVGRELVGHPDVPTALLVDGPKGFPALSILLAAAAVSDVRLLAQHNLDPGVPEQRLLEERTEHRALHYEVLIPPASTDAWRELGARELAHLGAAGAARNLDHSSLAMVRVTPDLRRKMLRTVDPRLSILQPAAVAAAWRVRRYGLLRQVARISFAIQRRTGLGSST